MAPAGQHQALVGRDSELGELSSLLGVRPSRAWPSALPNVVLLAGDAGVGKTRLLTELRDVAFGAGWQVVAGHCVDFGDSALPYLPFSEVVSRLASDLPDVVEAVGRAHPALARLQPRRRPLPTATEGPSLDRADLFAAIHALLEAAAGAAPLLLVVEDAHWADRSTRDLVSFLISRPFAAPVGIVVSYRAEDLHRRHPLRGTVAEWSRVRGVQRLQLGPLSERAVRALVRELHPEPLAEADVADVVGRAEGNAFFVEELVGALRQSAGGGIPEDLADVLLVRLERLDEAATQVVRAMSVAGRRVTHALLSAASGLPAGTLDAALRSAVESHVLVISKDDSYSFRHALLAEAVYDDLLPGERVRLHAAYAAALCDDDGRGTAAELARHARAAMDLPTALRASVRAGEEAMAVGGPDEAARHYERALELAADRQASAEVDVSALVAATAEALVAAGLVHRAASLVERHLAAVPEDAAPAVRAQLHLHLAYTASLFDNEIDWSDHAERALALGPAEPGADRARMLAAYARVQAMHRRPQAREAALEALALAEQHHLPRTASDATTTLVGLDQRTAPQEELATALDEAARRAAETGAVQAELRALYLLGRTHQDRGDHEAARAAFQRAAERGRAGGVPWAPYAFDGRFMHAQVDYVSGAWDRALELTDVDGQAPPPVAEAMLSALRSAILVARGEPQEAAFARMRRSWDREGLIAILAGPAEMEALGRAGDVDGVLTVHDEVVRTLAPTWGPHFQARVRLAATAVAAVSAALPATSTQDRAPLAQRAAQLYAEGRQTFAFHAESGLVWGPEGRAWVARLDAEHLRLRWLLDADPPSYDALVAGWRKAEAAFVELAHVHELAVTRSRLAAVLRAAGDTAAAREVADLARAAATELGAVTVLGDLRLLGSSPQRAEPAGGVGLTPRETEILTLVAAGRSNGEIGRQLFISTKTVSVHVSNILGKLGAAGRTEAAAIGRRRGLIDA
ncbi:helix-turn-helix transcriptional regulator [Nocardioides donggukensis]|uniref:AAA family ATPase n=1 Tax=Nocardioides donggukensis TaxID=2774019 RepID=A0A927PZ07_9ACTN|nr:helix-turn-helix transcriptional regulator [Nocardioides donggukensis]MBD8868215.1 AAA family ATPase [Nocardioides donggukensis]